MPLDELDILLPAKRAPYAFQSGHRTTGRRLHRFGDTWEFVVDDVDHPDMGLEFRALKPTVRLRDTYGLILGRRYLNLIRVGLVGDVDGGTVGMVPNAG